MNLVFQDGISQPASQPLRVLSQLLGNPAHFLMQPTIHHLNCYHLKISFLGCLRGTARSTVLQSLALMLCCHHFAILSNFYQGPLPFHFPWCLLNNITDPGSLTTFANCNAQLTNPSSFSDQSHNFFFWFLFLFYKTAGYTGGLRSYLEYA